uniref:Uncharacterized protein n=1 Tax=Sinocyclocheilus grahami TaxID=75366 RepID=A0A672P9E0_SINGR
LILAQHEMDVFFLLFGAFMLLPPRRFHLSATVAGPSGQQGPRGPPSAPRHTHSRARHIHTHRPELQT